MDWLQVMVVLLPPVILFAIGYLIRCRKAYWLISGYNTMSKEKKQKVDTEKLGILMGNACFVMGVIFLAGFLLLFLHQTLAGTVVLALICPVIIFLLIAAQKYDGNTRQPSGKMSTGSMILIGVIILSILVVAGLVGLLLYRGSQPASITLENNTLTISGIYGQAIPVAEIQKVNLLDALPAVRMRTNGSAVGDQLRGHFSLQDIGQAMLYLDRSQPPFIYLETGSQKIYFNLATPEQTRQLYDQLKVARP